MLRERSAGGGDQKKASTNRDRICRGGGLRAGGAGGVGSIGEACDVRIEVV